MEALLTRRILDLNFWRVASALVLIFLVSSDSPYWWIVAIPWLTLNLVGFLAIAAAFVVFAAGAAGGAQADWVSDSIVIMTLFAAPTALSIAASLLFRRYLRRAGILGYPSP
jgi:hypothetical protein